jgi:hypothetical protein
VVTLGDLIERGLLCEPFGPRRIPTADVVAFAAPGQKPATHSDAFLGWLQAVAAPQG